MTYTEFLAKYAVLAKDPEIQQFDPPGGVEVKVYDIQGVYLWSTGIKDIFKSYDAEGSPRVIIEVETEWLSFQTGKSHPKE